MNLSLLLSQVKAPTTRRAKRLRWIAVVLLIYTVTGFFIAPAIIKSQLVKCLPGLTHRQAAVQQVKLNPYALSLTIRELSLTESNGEPFAGFDEFYINFQLSSLFRWAWTFSEIRLTHPTANLVRGADGQFNLANLIADGPSPPPDPARKSKALPVVLVQHLAESTALGRFDFQQCAGDNRFIKTTACARKLPDNSRGAGVRKVLVPRRGPVAYAPLQHEHRRIQRHHSGSYYARLDQGGRGYSREGERAGAVRSHRRHHA